MQPLHDEQHSDARAARVGVVDHRPVQVHQSLMFRQSPEPEGAGRFTHAQRDSTIRAAGGNSLVGCQNRALHSSNVLLTCTRQFNGVSQQRRHHLTWCNETPTPGRSSVCHQAVPLTLRRRGNAPPSCRRGTRPHTGLCPAPGRALAFLSNKRSSVFGLETYVGTINCQLFNIHQSGFFFGLMN